MIALLHVPCYDLCPQPSPVAVITPTDNYDLHPAICQGERGGSADSGACPRDETGETAELALGSLACICYVHGLHPLDNGACGSPGTEVI
jgi:hypothetical protein